MRACTNLRKVAPHQNHENPGRRIIYDLLEHSWRLHNNTFSLGFLTPTLFVKHAESTFVDESMSGILGKHFRCDPRSGSLRAGNHNSQVNCQVFEHRPSTHRNAHYNAITPLNPWRRPFRPYLTGFRRQPSSRKVIHE